MLHTFVKARFFLIIIAAGVIALLCMFAIDQTTSDSMRASVSCDSFENCKIKIFDVFEK